MELPLTVWATRPQADARYCGASGSASAERIRGAAWHLRAGCFPGLLSAGTAVHVLFNSTCRAVALVTTPFGPWVLRIPSLALWRGTRLLVARTIPASAASALVGGGTVMDGRRGVM